MQLVIMRLNRVLFSLSTPQAIERASKRTIKVTKEHNEECKRLLRLMGVPVVDAPSEAEAQCAAMSKDGASFRSRAA